MVNFRKWRRRSARDYQIFARARPITRTELEQLRRALPWRDGLACAIMADTGLRVSDALAIHRDALAEVMTVKEKKTGKMRKVRLRPETLSECFAYLRTTDSPYVIDCHRSTLWRSITAAASAFGWTHITPHSFRKLFACEFCAKYGILATQRELQHKNVETTLAYLGDLNDLIALLGKAGT